MKPDSPPPDCLPCPEEAHVTIPPPRWLVIAAFAAVYVIWGSTFLAIRLAIDTIPPLLMAGGRFTLAGLILYAVMRLRGIPKPTPAQWRDATIIGALAATEMALSLAGVPHKKGGVQVAMDYLITAHSAPVRVAAE